MAVSILVVGGLLVGVVLFGLLGSRVSMSPPTVPSPSFLPSGGFPAPAISIRDGNGREITDPAMRAAIEEQIEKNRK